LRLGAQRTGNEESRERPQQHAPEFASLTAKQAREHLHFLKSIAAMAKPEPQALARGPGSIVQPASFSQNQLASAA
jgi:hypothetical protein